jgi:L-aspartate semialdehyde sulfurtransferase ferredoxin
MTTKKIVLHFSKENYNRPIVYRLVKDFNLSFNILKASILPRQDSFLVLELSGPKADFKRGLEYLAEVGVGVEPIEKNVVRIDLKCTHCGACTAVCPTGSLSINRKTMEVIFDSTKCSACEMCIKACPPRAMESRFE